MELLVDRLFECAPYVHYLSFFLLILAGFNLPISEDIVFIVSSSIAATIAPENKYYIFLACFLGAYIGDCIAFLIGRLAGTRILQTGFFIKRISHEKMEKMRGFFQKYGDKTVFLGRFIPFGVRNIVFISAGVGKMNVIKFLLTDFMALTFTSSILLSLGYYFGKNYKVIFSYINKFKLLMLILFILMIVIVLINIFISRGRRTHSLS